MAHFRNFYTVCYFSFFLKYIPQDFANLHHLKHDYSIGTEEQTFSMSTPELPPRIFAAGEEPSGYRVNSYHKVKITQSILRALTEDEVEFFRNSSFSKVISHDDNPPFSGAFCYFILARRLKTNKKYEFWVLFAGTPIRISLREFAIVIGLNCGRLPNSRGRKRKKSLNEKLY